MSITIEHDSHIIEDRRIFRTKSASDIFEKAGGIVTERSNRKIIVVRISSKVALDLCENFDLNYIGPLCSHDAYYNAAELAKDVTPKGP